MHLVISMVSLPDSLSFITGITVPVKASSQVNHIFEKDFYEQRLRTTRCFTILLSAISCSNEVRDCCLLSGRESQRGGRLEY